MSSSKEELESIKMRFREIWYIQRQSFNR